MGKIRDNGGVYMTIITREMIIPRKQANCYLRYGFKFYRTSFARIRPDQI